MSDAKTFNNIDLQNLFKVKNSLDPTAPQDLVTLQYLTNYVAGVRDPKDAARAATVSSNIALGAAPNVLDGVTLAANDRILVKNQTTSSQNGLYFVSTLGTGANGVWTRTPDADTSAEVTSGLFCYITEGTVNAHSGWLLTTVDPIVLGTTALAFTQVTGLADVTAGNALTKTGNQLDVNVDGSTININGSDQLQIHPSYVGQTSIVTVGTITTGTWNGTTIAIANGGTGATTAGAARTNLGAAASGANSDITSLSGLTTALSVAQGGTGSTTAAGARTNLGAVGKYATTIASGSTTYNITHNLGTTDVSVPFIYDTTSNIQAFGVIATVVDSNTVQLDFGTTTSLGYRVIIEA